MHHHLEIIMPPTKNVEGAITQILDQFDEEGKDNTHAFWDWYVLGGRWAGTKLEAMLGADKIQEFRDLLVKEKITVSGLQCGKQSLQPESQIERVDKMWNEMFPDSPVKQCPLFEHYESDYGDTCKLSDVPRDLTASRVIIAKKHWEDKNKREAEFMLSTEIRNGCAHQDTTWDGNILEAIKQYKKRLKNMSEEFKKENTPKANWICVTVDYHS